MLWEAKQIGGTLYWVTAVVDTPGTGADSVPRYEVDPPVIDQLVAKMFKLCSRNPVFFTGGLNDHACEIITRNNPIGEQLVPPDDSLMNSIPEGVAILSGKRLTIVQIRSRIAQDLPLLNRAAASRS
jgi:hypothetical protein